MSQDIDFPDYPYFSVKYVHPNASALNNLMYPSFIARYQSRLVLVADDGCPLPPRFGSCRTWNARPIAPGANSREWLEPQARGPLSSETEEFLSPGKRLSQTTLDTPAPGQPAMNATLAHNHRGTINPRLLSWALARPQEVTQLLRRRRLPRLTYRTLCGRPGCLHPLHQVCDQDPGFNRIGMPRKRTRRQSHQDWLTYPETSWLTYKMLTSFNKDLGEVITQICETIGIHYSTLVNIWNTIVDLDRKGFYETFICKR